MNNSNRFLTLSAVLLLILCSGCADKPRGDQALAEAQSISAQWLMERVSYLADDTLEGRDNLSPGGQLAREYLVAELEALGVEPLGSQGYQQEFDQGINLVGLIPGRDDQLKDEYVAIGAHYDHLGSAANGGSQCRSLDGDDICNGASDNGSGCAAVLAIAKTLQEGQGPRRSVVIILFDSEEDGLLGSHHFAGQEPLVPVQSLIAFINLDTIGVHIIPGEQSSFVLGVEYNTGLRELVWQINEQVDYVNYPVSSFFDGSEEGTRSDHYPFRLAGVPALFYGSGSPPEYHTPADEPHIMDQHKFLSITRHAFLFTRHLCRNPVYPEFTALPQPHLDDARAMKNLGQKILAAPDAVGLDDPLMIGILEGWMEQLDYYLDNPPQTPQEWEEYDSFIRTVIDTALTAVGA